LSTPRVTLITGASQGIGREIALAFARQGDFLVLAARDREKLEATAGAANQAGARAVVVPTDVTKPDDVERAVAAAIEEFGRIDVLINNSGIGGPSGPLWELSLEDWQSTFAVNVEGVFLLSRAVIPHMIEDGGGSIVNIGSITGKRPLWGRTAYAATKSALVGLTRTLATEAGRHGIRVNLISPGFVAGPRLDWVIEAQAEGRGLTTDQVREELEGLSALHRLTQPLDIARVAVFLASDEAQAITGADINANSGVVMY
jgi:NAD(P)-dependent dehydrogenase (short-subunit alcohol dehydrogenase family)